MGDTHFSDVEVTRILAPVSGSEPRRARHRPLIARKNER